MLKADACRYGCWQNSDNGYMAKFMAANGIAAGDYPGLQAYFEQKVIELVRKLPVRLAGDATDVSGRDPVHEALLRRIVCHLAHPFRSVVQSLVRAVSRRIRRRMLSRLLVCRIIANFCDRKKRDF